MPGKSQQRRLADFNRGIWVAASTASAREYGNYDPKRLLTVSKTSSGKKYGFDSAYLDQMLNDLSAHAKNYPPQFDTPQDKQRATQDVRTLSGMLDILINVPTPNPERLRLDRDREASHDLNRLLDEPGEGSQTLCKYLLNPAPHLGAERPPDILFISAQLSRKISSLLTSYLFSMITDKIIPSNPETLVSG